MVYGVVEDPGSTEDGHVGRVAPKETSPSGLFGEVTGNVASGRGNTGDGRSRMGLPRPSQPPTAPEMADEDDPDDNRPRELQRTPPIAQEAGSTDRIQHLAAEPERAQAEASSVEAGSSFSTNQRFQAVQNLFADRRSRLEKEEGCCRKSGSQIKSKSSKRCHSGGTRFRKSQTSHLCGGTEKATAGRQNGTLEDLKAN